MVRITLKTHFLTLNVFHLMSRISLAFRCLFQLLFRGQLPAAAFAYLPAPVAPSAAPDAALAPAGDGVAARRAPASAEPAQLRTEGALLLLSLFQREGRLLDFLRESLEQHDDAAIGAAVRAVHRGCKKVLDEHVTLKPVMPGEEDGPVTVQGGFDPSEIQLTGTTLGNPPFRGTLVHHGWRAAEVRFPTLTGTIDRRVLAPAEVRVP
jgi:hypothetical protein